MDGPDGTSSSKRFPERGSAEVASPTDEYFMSRNIVARYQDGRILKGISMDVDANKPLFHLKPREGPIVEIQLSELKALFFVRSFDGDAARNDSAAPDPADPRSRGSSTVRVRFADGEEIVGLTIRYPPNRPFFFVVPVDAQSNNIRILINRDAVESIEQADDAGS
jgi:Family of unknown function (DUF6982)